MSERLLSEGFENAAWGLKHSLDNFGGIDSNAMAVVVRDFEHQIDRFRDILGMQAENMQRAAVGASMAYTEAHFQNI